MRADEKTRTFLAVYPDAPTIQKLARLAADLKPRIAAVRWVDAAQLHFTLRFFGDLDQAQIEAALAALGRVTPAFKAPSIPLNGLGVFPDWRRPRVLWVGTGAGGEELEELARRLDLAFSEAGLGRADKPFKAHLTVGRFREGEKLTPELVGLLKSQPFATPPFSVSEVRLMASSLNPHGAEHSVIQTFPIGASGRK